MNPIQMWFYVKNRYLNVKTLFCIILYSNGEEWMRWIYFSAILLLIIYTTFCDTFLQADTHLDFLSLISIVFLSEYLKLVPSTTKYNHQDLMQCVSMAVRQFLSAFNRLRLHPNDLFGFFFFYQNACFLLLKISIDFEETIFIFDKHVNAVFIMIFTLCTTKVNLMA